MVDRLAVSVGRRSYLAVGTFRSVMLNLKLVLVVARYLESIGVNKHRLTGQNSQNDPLSIFCIMCFRDQ